MASSLLRRFPGFLVATAVVIAAVSGFWAGRLVARSVEPRGAGGIARRGEASMDGSHSRGTPAQSTKPTESAAGLGKNATPAWLAAFVGPAGRLAVDKAAAAARAMLKLHDPAEQMRCFADLMERLTPESAPEVWRQLRENIPPGMMPQYLPLMAWYWAKADPAGALKSFSDVDGPDGFTGSVASLAAWAESDPKAAEAWCRTNATDKNRAAYLTGLALGTSRTDFDRAVAVASSMPTEHRQGMAVVLADQRLRRDTPEATARWALSLPDTEMRDAALWAAVRMWTRSDPASAGELVSSVASERWARNAAVRVVDKWMPQAPGQAVAWAEQHIPAGETQDAAIRQAFLNWTQKDMTAASQRLIELPPGHLRDVAIATVARNVATQEPDSAMQWIPQIREAGLQQETLIQAGRRWHQRDATAAQSWFDSHHPALVREIAKPAATEPSNWFGASN